MEQPNLEQFVTGMRNAKQVSTIFQQWEEGLRRNVRLTCLMDPREILP